ncbi:hypothetical protein KIL84_008659 [Mauremys mutica]|uniref:Uncharacterized protein n=1 Tax=Mauremys mutica TaxID=74926 RepID=A0A9D3X875_9SAUR|nr:hypothetical protein KIL84_008659 [Mauremys mutica]
MPTGAMDVAQPSPPSTAQEPLSQAHTPARLRPASLSHSCFPSFCPVETAHQALSHCTAVSRGARTRWAGHGESRLRRCPKAGRGRLCLRGDGSIEPENLVAMGC